MGLRQTCVKLWAAFNNLRIWSSSGHFWKRYRTFELRKRRRISCL